MIYGKSTWLHELRQEYNVTTWTTARVQCDYMSSYSKSQRVKHCLTREDGTNMLSRNVGN
jgi:hypothetical protein